jgi:CHASE2 domain-containing sensor protein
MNHREFFKQFIANAWALLKRRSLSLQVWTAGGADLRNMVMSWSAMMSRQFGARSIILIGVGATVFALFLFLSHQMAAQTTSASHDAILQKRWASPAPSKQIIIVDIDERSLAALAPEHGRWPWHRGVLADGLERLSQAGVRAVLFNVMLTDPDKSNPDADSAMEAAAALMRNVAFPVIRLNPANDALSALKVSYLLGKTGDATNPGSNTVAVLLPLFETMHDRLGVANQKPDSDGIVRNYPLVWSDAVLTMPSIVARTVNVAGATLEGRPASIALNWRNKFGRYQRVSFSDLMAAPAGAALLQPFKNAVVVLGVSAPGLGQTKPTAVRSLEDDNEILATALDDVLHDTHLRVMPHWLVLLIEVCIVWVLVWLGIGREISLWLNKAFLLIQSGAGFITMISASYSNYLIDLTICMAFGIGIFGAIKLAQALDAGWSRARPGLRRAVGSQGSGVILLLGYRDSQVNRSSAFELQEFLESRVGLPRVIRVDDLFGGESFARKVCEDYSCLLCLLEDHEVPGLLTALRSLPVRGRVDIRHLDSAVSWDPDATAFRAFIAPSMLRQCADLLEPAGQPNPPNIRLTPCMRMTDGA